MRMILGAILLFGLGVVVGTAGSNDSLLQEAKRDATRAYDQGFAGATAKFQSLAIQVGHATWEPGVEPREPRRFVWKQKQLEDIAEVEDNLYFIPITWQPDPARPAQHVLLRVRNLPDEIAATLSPTAG